MNETYRFTENPSNLLDSSTFMIDISGNFNVNQLVNIITFDHDISIEFGASYRVIARDGSTHTFDGLFPQFIFDASDRYTNSAKYAYSSPVDYIMQSTSAFKGDGSINIYTNDYRQYFIDSTFSIMNLPFNHETIINNWYDNEDLINAPFYYYDKVTTVDISTLVILRAEYDNSNYMLNQKNIWTIRDADTGELVARVHNKDVPYIFGTDTNYDISVETYDYYGNLKRTR
jgi:hypothetical protein